MRENMLPWVVWSFKHDAWWGPDQCGYFTDLMLAGLYTEATAKEIERRDNGAGFANVLALSIEEALNRALRMRGVAGEGCEQRVAGRVLSLLEEITEVRDRARELRYAGALLSNFAYNLEQRPTLDAHAIALLRECRLKWDRTTESAAPALRAS